MFRVVNQWWNRTSDVCRVCYATGIVALLVALVGAVLNPFVGNWFHSTGMAFIGLFYLVLGITSWPLKGTSAVGAENVIKLFHLQSPQSTQPTASASRPTCVATSDK